MQFQDTLRDSTTYTLDFGDGVCDFRERVPLHGFTFYFSTGAEIDTLDHSGYVYDAENLNPMKGIIVGIHESMEDSVLTTLPFTRVARTDTAGFFRINNMRAGAYRLYAIDDVSRDYRLTVSEAMAFADEPIEVTEKAIDSVMPPMTRLFLFKEEQQRLYLQRTLREQQHTVRFLFSTSPDSIPELRPLTDSLHYFTHYSAAKDTITWWLLDSMSIAQDSLFIEARYRRTDSLYHLEWYTDTLRAIWRAPKMTAKAREAQERKNRNRRLELKSNARSGFEIYDTLQLSCSTPLAGIAVDSIHLFVRVDTVLKPMPFTLAEHDTLPMKIYLLADLKPEGQYELTIDSGALHDIYGITHIAGRYPLQLKSLTDYSTLRVKMLPFDPSIRIQVLNAQDKVVRELPATEEGALFEYLKPGAYYLRCYMDINRDGKWTTGNWTEKRQPEPVYYFPDKIQTKSNWDFEEEWDYTATEQTKAKPKELIKASSNEKGHKRN